MQKNVASQKWIVFAFDRTDNTPKTGDAGNITANLRIDGAGANAVDDTNPTELEDGFYIFDITATESNGNCILITPESATADIQVIGVPGVVYTTPPNFDVLGIESDGDLTKVNTLDGHTAQTANHTAGIADIPTVSEFNARTLVTAAYFDPSVDAVANVTTVATLTGHSVQTGDNYARLGAPVGASLSADLSALKAETVLIVADTNELELDWKNGGRLDLIIDAILVDSAELQTDWANGGRLDVILDTAAAGGGGDATEDKQDTIITNLAAIPTTAMRGTDGANTTTPPTVAAIADAIWDETQSSHVAVGSFGIIASEIAAIPTTAMRGTDSSALASICTESRLAELDSGNIPADVDAILVDTSTTLDDHLTDIKGTSFVKDTHSLIDIETYVDLIDDGTSGLAKIATDAAATLADTATTIPATITTLQTDVTQIKGDLPTTVTKNAALSNWPFLMIDSADDVSGKTGVSITAERSLDGAAFASCANSATELSDGVYTINFAATDTNANTIMFRFSASGANDTFMMVVTQP